MALEGFGRGVAVEVVGFCFCGHCGDTTVRGERSAVDDSSQCDNMSIN